MRKSLNSFGYCHFRKDLLDIYVLFIYLFVNCSAPFSFVDQRVYRFYFEYIYEYIFEFIMSMFLVLHFADVSMQCSENVSYILED